MDWEIRHHLQERADTLMAEGFSRDEAMREAKRRFGSTGRVREELRRIDRGRARSLRLLDLAGTVAQDIRYGLRGTRQNPGFTTALVLTLALGIGANVALFTVVDALLLRPLPYAAPEELAVAALSRPGEPRGRPYFSWDMIQLLRERATFLGGVMPHTRATVLFTGGPEPETLPGTPVGPEFHRVLGVRAEIGRGFLAEDAAPGAPATVLLGHGFWRRAFGGDPDVVGNTVTLDGVGHTVIGVMPEGFKFPEYSTTDFWIPIRDDGTALGRQGAMELLVRVPDARYDVARERALALGEALLEERAAELDLTLIPVQEWRARGRGLRQALVLLGGAVVLILLIAGVNMVNLLLVRGAVRTRELAVRLALGASRARVVRQLGTEALILALLSGVVAVLLALAAVAGMRQIMPPSISFYAAYDFELGARALLFTFVIAVASGLAFGLLPALGVTRRARSACSEGLTVYAASGPGKSRLRRGLVVAEVGLSVLLLSGAGLLTNSFIRLTAVDPGFRPQGLAIMTLSVSAASHPEPEQRADHLRRIKERIAAIPGVERVSVGLGFPPGAGSVQFGVVLEPEGGDPVEVPGILPSVGVDEDFVEVSGVRLMAGRAFSEEDLRSGDALIVDEDLARRLWPSGAAVGRRVRFRAEEEWRTVVGVVRDLRLEGPDDREVEFSYLSPLRPGPAGQLSLGIRTAGDPRTFLPAIRAAVRDVAPDQPIHELAPAEALYARTLAMPRFLLVLMGILAGLAVTLAAIGIFGVLLYDVSRRAREFGVRMALGARANDLRRLVVREGLALAGVGALMGLLGALALGRLMAAWLYGLRPTDPLTLALVSATVMAIALAACLQPAARATRTDPARVLKAD